MITTINALSMPEFMIRSADPHTAVISMTDLGTASPANPAEWARVFALQFDDSGYTLNTPPFLYETIRNPDHGYPTPHHVTLIRTFLRDVQTHPAMHHLLIHCHGGQSRSTAGARDASEQFGVLLATVPPHDNHTVYQLLATPNMFDRIGATPPHTQTDPPSSTPVLHTLLQRLRRWVSRDAHGRNRAV